MFGNRKTDEEKDQEIHEKYGLDLDSYDVARIKRENAKNLQEIGKDLAGKKFMKAGMAFSLAPAHEQASVGYLSAIFNTNLILIRQNELIIRHLERLLDK